MKEVKQWKCGKKIDIMIEIMVDIASLPSCEGSKKEVRDKLGETDDRCQVEGKEGSRRNKKKDIGDGASENKESIGWQTISEII